MKKLSIILALLLITATTAMSQKVYQRFVTNNVRTADTGYAYTVTEGNYCWQILAKWSANNGTTAKVKIQTSVDGTAWHDYANMDSVTVTGTTGSAAFEDDKVTGRYLRVYFRQQTGKTTTWNCYISLKPR